MISDRLNGSQNRTDLSGDLSGFYWHNLPDFLIYAALVPKLGGSRLILDLHDLMPEFYAARFNRGMKSWPVRLLCWQEYVSCRFANHVITVTELWRRTLIRRGVPP